MTETETRNPQAEAPEATLPKRGRIAAGSHLSALDQARLYQETMGLEATKRQMRLRREELAKDKAAPKAPGRAKAVRR